VHLQKLPLDHRCKEAREEQKTAADIVKAAKAAHKATMPIAAMAAATVVPHSLADGRLTPAAVTPAAATVVVAACNPPTEGQGRELRERGEEQGQGY
jgi:hypothetical protein